MNKSGFFKKFVLIFKDLFVFAVLLPVTTDIANAPKLLTELLRIGLKLALFRAAYVLIFIELKALEAEIARIQLV